VNAFSAIAEESGDEVRCSSSSRAVVLSSEVAATAVGPVKAAEESDHEVRCNSSGNSSNWRE
jgi:hypothetical protein